MLVSSLHLDTDESVIFEVRRHWIVFIFHAVFHVFLALFPAIVYVLFLEYVPSSITTAINSYPIAILFYSLWLLVLWTTFFLQWTKYYLDVWYVTQKRIIDVDQKNLFHREVSNLRFDKIQDISIEVKGVVATFFNYGNVRVQTASEVSEFFMKDVKNPEKVKQIIFSQHNVASDSSINTPAV